LKFFGPFFSVLNRIACGLEIELSHKFRVADIRIRVAVAVETPFHRKRSDLGDDFHFVNTTMTRNATDAAVNMYCVIEINEVWKIVNPIPQNGLVRFQAFTNGRQQCALRFDYTQCYGLTGVVHLHPIAAVAIAAG
jgi:hypothetical protein